VDHSEVDGAPPVERASPVDGLAQQSFEGVPAAALAAEIPRAGRSLRLLLQVNTGEEPE
jgi:hypothetical protein